MKLKIIIILLFIGILNKSQSYSSGSVFVEKVNTTTHEVSSTTYLGSVESIVIHRNNDIDIKFYDRSGDLNLILLKNIPDMASLNFKYMKDVNSKTNEEFFVGNLISTQGVLVLLSAFIKEDSRLRLQIAQIK